MPSLTFAGPPGALDELNIWSAAPVAAPREFSLGENADPRPARDAIRWEQELRPAGPDMGDLAAAEGRLTAARDALPQAEGRVMVFTSAGGLAAGVDPELAGPERDLADWVAAGRSGAASLPGGQFSAEAAVELAQRPDFRESAEQVAAFFQKVREAVRNYATVVTRAGGAAVAATEVSWTGDFRAAWGAGLSLEEARKHSAAVTLALRTRDLWLRLAATVLRGAFQLAALFAVNPLMALPAAYRFVRQVIDQAQALHATIGQAA